MKAMPMLTPERSTVKVTSAFRGYNHNDIIADGEMFDMQNMTGEKYPVLAQRRKRGISSFDVSGQEQVPLTGIHGRDQLVFIRGEDVYYNFSPVTGLAVSANETMLPKKIVSFGAYVLIFPDKKYFNTADLDDCGSMERLWPAASSSITGADVALSMCRGDGTDYDMTSITQAASAPENPANNDLWIDTSGSNDVLMQYSEATAEWVEIATTFVKIACTGIGAGLKEYDAITISGLEAPDGSTDKVQAQVNALNGSMIVYFRGDDYIVVAGLLSQSQAALAANEIRADLKIPGMDFVVESNNRLWGCTYGLAEDGQFVNEIRASKLGDFRNWNTYMGLSTDSYTASVGTDGAFTGACTQRGYPVFFKENCIHRVSGSLPSNFMIQTTMCRGVQRDSWRSVQVVAENIYYKSRGGVMVYDGNMPQEVGEQLGEMLYSNARAGVLDDKYYISMEDSVGNWRLFVYDTTHGSWWKEDSTQALGFGAAEDDLFFIDENANTLVSVRGSVGTEETDFDWAAEFDLFGVNWQGYEDPKQIRNSIYLSLFKIRMYLAPGAFMRLWIKYDENLYELKCERWGHDMRTFVLPVLPKRADHVRFKVTGHGEAKIYDISRVLEVGGDG